MLPTLLPTHSPHDGIYLTGPLQHEHDFKLVNGPTLGRVWRSQLKGLEIFIWIICQRFWPPAIMGFIFRICGATLNSLVQEQATYSTQDIAQQYFPALPCFVSIYLFFLNPESHQINGIHVCAHYGQVFAFPQLILFLICIELTYPESRIWD